MPTNQEEFTAALKYDLARVREKTVRFKLETVPAYAHLFHALQNSDDIFRAAAEEMVFTQCLAQLERMSKFENFKMGCKDRLIARARVGSRSTSDTSNLCYMYETAALAYVVSLFGE